MKPVVHPNLIALQSGPVSPAKPAPRPGGQSAAPSPAGLRQTHSAVRVEISADALRAARAVQDEQRSSAGRSVNDEREREAEGSGVSDVTAGEEVRATGSTTFAVSQTPVRREAPFAVQQFGEHARHARPGSLVDIRV